jgi:hypothetical protein
MSFSLPLKIEKSADEAFAKTFPAMTTKSAKKHSDCV